jgi:hypothetical protein
MHLCTLTLLLLLLLLQEGKLDDLSKMIDILQEAGFHKTQFFKDQVRPFPIAESYMLNTLEALHARICVPHMRLMRTSCTQSSSFTRLPGVVRPASSSKAPFRTVSSV